MRACMLECARSHQPLTGQAAEQVSRHSFQWAGSWARQQEPQVSPSFSHSVGGADCLRKLQADATAGKGSLAPQLFCSSPLNGGTMGFIPEGTK